MRSSAGRRSHTRQRSLVRRPSDSWSIRESKLFVPTTCPHTQLVELQLWSNILLASRCLPRCPSAVMVRRRWVLVQRLRGPRHPGARPLAGGWIDRCSPRCAQDPGYDRVRVPHLARVEIVTAPHGRRYRWQRLEDSSGDLDIVGDPGRASDRLIYVGDPAVSPAPNLIAEDPESAEPPHSDGTLRHDTAPFPIQIWDRRLLNHEVTFWSGDNKR